MMEWHILYVYPFVTITFVFELNAFFITYINLWRLSCFGWNMFQRNLDWFSEEKVLAHQRALNIISSK